MLQQQQQQFYLPPLENLSNAQKPRGSVLSSLGFADFMYIVGIVGSYTTSCHRTWVSHRAQL